MTPDLSITVDYRGLSEKMTQIADIFYKRGAQPTAIQTFVQVEAAQLAKDAANAVGPKGLEKGVKRIENRVGKFLADDEGRDINFTRENQQGHGDVRWLSAGPSWLLGVKREDDKMNIGGEDAVAIFKKGLLSTPDGRGLKFQKVVSRKQQAVNLLNRTRVNSAAFAAVVKKISERLGIARATFAASAIELGIKSTFPAWVTRHIGDVRSSGKSFIDMSGLFGSGSPEVTFGSHAPGVEANYKMRESIKKAVEKRENAIKDKFEKLIGGAVYNINTGQVYHVIGRDLESGEI